jgi:hypothetical protein
MAATAIAQDELTLLAPSPLTVIFEYTVGADGSPRNINMIRCEDSTTREEVKDALTEKQKQIGVRIIVQRKRGSGKDAGKKLYEFLLFDRTRHQYLIR